MSNMFDFVLKDGTPVTIPSQTFTPQEPLARPLDPDQGGALSLVEVSPTEPPIVFENGQGFVTAPSGVVVGQGSVIEPPVPAPNVPMLPVSPDLLPTPSQFVDGANIQTFVPASAAATPGVAAPPVQVVPGPGLPPADDDEPETPRERLRAGLQDAKEKIRSSLFPNRSRGSAGPLAQRLANIQPLKRIRRG